MSLKFALPKFQSEAEEAEWWDQHRDETAQWMEAAVTVGETTTLSAVLERARERSGAAAIVTIRVDPPDAERARALAAQKGIPCETYLKTLLHDALDRDEQHR
jgi:predicted DNA binding CopG/RHH family protein